MPVALALIGTLFGLAGAAAALVTGQSPQTVMLAWYVAGWAAVLASLSVALLRRATMAEQRPRR